MDSNKNNNGDNDTNECSSSRGRHLSESEETSGKRQKTADNGNGNQSPPPSAFNLTSASPPRFILLEEVMNATKGLTNMALAHEIAVDKDFKVTPREPPPESFERRVQDMMHRAYWDILREQLNQDPPDFTKALSLLNEIKDNLNKLMLPHHVKLKQEINEMLDTELIKQQAEHGTLDFNKYAKYVISIMGKLCSPARDENIKELLEKTDIVDVFKGIMEAKQIHQFNKRCASQQTLRLMEIDMVNFTIQIIRPGIVDYEKTQFKKFLDAKKLEGSTGLEITTEWLKKHVNPEKLNQTRTEILNSAFMDLLKSDLDPLPETLIADSSRLSSLKNDCDRLSVIAAIIPVTMNTVGSSLADISDFRSKLKEHLCLLIPESATDKEIKEALPNVSEQVVKDSNEFLEKHGFPKLAKETENIITGQILSIAQPDHNVKNIMRKRIYEFISHFITSERPNKQQIPSGLGSLQYELAMLSKKFVQQVSHNKAVFGEFYDQIFASLLPQ